MAHLPEVSYGSDYRSARQGQFGGLKHCRSCSDGEIYDMNNITLDEFPLIKTRKPRKRFASINREFVMDFYADNQTICYIVGMELVIHGVGTLITDLKTGVKHQFVRFGNRVVLLPEMRLLNLNYEILGIVDNATQLPESGNKFGDAFAVLNTVMIPFFYDIYVYDGSQWVNNGRFDKPMSADTGVQPAVEIGNDMLSRFETEGHADTVVINNSLIGITDVLGLKEGDAVTISGCTTEPDNNKTAIIREIKGDRESTSIRFSDYCFKIPENADSYIERNVKIERRVPDMDFMFECNNRLWGAKGKTIYASKLGDPTNWYFFDGLSIDSWSIDTQSKGNIVGGWGDYYPYFLREDGMTIVCGSVPSGYQCYDKSAILGLKKGEERSIAHAGGYTLWLSREGMVLFGDDTGRIMKDIFRDWNLNDIKAVSAGTKAYFLCWTEKEHNFGMDHVIFCFDSRTGLWEKQDGSGYTELAYDGGVLYGLIPAEERSDINILNGGTELQENDETEIYSNVQFGDFYSDTENRKATDLLMLRVEMEPNAELNVYIKYDSCGEYELLETISGGENGISKRTIDIPITPRRCDHYHIMLMGHGQWTLYAMSRNIRTGSERQ